MANIGVSSVKIRDEDGDVAAVTSNALHVTMTDSDRGVGSAMLSYTQFAAVDGTAVNLSDSTNGINATVTNCLEVIVQADYDNSGYIMVGGSGVLADTKGVRLNAEDTPGSNARAFSFAFWVFCRGELSEKTRRHEAIHYQQQLEMLFIFPQL